MVEFLNNDLFIYFCYIFCFKPDEKWLQLQIPLSTLGAIEGFSINWATGKKQKIFWLSFILNTV